MKMEHNMIIGRSTKILTKIVFISSSQKYKSEPRIMLKAKIKGNKETKLHLFYLYFVLRLETVFTALRLI